MADFGKQWQQWQQYGGIHCSYAILCHIQSKFYCTKTVGKNVPK